jgi:hypothetical protein
MTRRGLLLWWRWLLLLGISAHGIHLHGIARPPPSLIPFISPIVGMALLKVRGPARFHALSSVHFFPLETPLPRLLHLVVQLHLNALSL